MSGAGRAVSEAGSGAGGGNVAGGSGGGGTGGVPEGVGGTGGGIEEHATGYDTTCASTADCEAEPADCCPLCTEAKRTSYLAMNRAAMQAFYAAECAGVLCFDCSGPPTPTVFPLCVRGRCQMIDLRDQPEVVACSQHSDCRLRNSACCECSDAFDNIPLAVSDARAYERLRCRGERECTGSCNPQYDGRGRAFLRSWKLRRCIPKLRLSLSFRMKERA